MGLPASFISGFLTAIGPCLVIAGVVLAGLLSAIRNPSASR
jgi:hypothetical protein